MQGLGAQGLKTQGLKAHGLEAQGANGAGCGRSRKSATQREASQPLSSEVSIFTISTRRLRSGQYSAALMRFMPKFARRCAMVSSASPRARSRARRRDRGRSVGQSLRRYWRSQPAPIVGAERRASADGPIDRSDRSTGRRDQPPSARRRGGPDLGGARAKYGSADATADHQFPSPTIISFGQSPVARAAGALRTLRCQALRS